MIEEWKDVVDFEGLYEVSSLGQVRTKEGKITIRADGQVRVWKQRILKLKTDKGGYKRVCLWKDGKDYYFLVHRLVAMAFIPNPNNYPLINHEDGITSNNEPTNLTWCDYSYNLEHAYENGLNISAHEVVLVHKETKEEIRFNSKSKASRFLGFNNGWLSGVLKRNREPIHDTYIIKA